MNESPGYLTRGTDSVYFVHHPAQGVRRAAVVLAGPMGLERTHAYIVWVRWARHLAARGLDVLRFDYRGVAESSGSFAEMTFHHWEEDLRAGLEHLRGLCPEGPVFLHGLRLGALLAARVFQTGAADGLLMWDPPESGRAHLMEVLRRKVGADNLEGTGGSARSREDYIARLEAGEHIEVEGLSWSQGLWRSAEAYPLALPSRDEKRPWRAVHLDGRPAEKLLAPEHGRSVRTPRPFFWTAGNRLLPELGELVEDGAAFLSSAGVAEVREEVRS